MKEKHIGRVESKEILYEELERFARVCIPMKSPPIPKQIGTRAEQSGIREIGAKRRWDFVHSLRPVFVASQLIIFWSF